MTQSADPSIKRFLERHHIDPAALLGAGMEAEVYAYEAATVLRIHRDVGGFARLNVIKEFYDQLAQQPLPFTVPALLQIGHVAGCLVSIERRLYGKLMANMLGLNPDANMIDRLMHGYIDGVDALSRVHPPAGFERYKLLDPLNLSDRRAGDWNSFLTKYVLNQAASAMQYLERVVTQFEQKLARLIAGLSTYYSGDHRLIHGDFSPGNLLFDDRHNVSAVFDFG